jgi:hypothetical protein
MNWEEDLYSAFETNEDASPKALAVLVDNHRVILDRALAQLPFTARSQDVFALAGYGLAFSGRYGESLRFARAALPDQADMSTMAAEMARTALIHALHGLGRNTEALRELAIYRRQWPDHAWAKYQELLIGYLLQRRHARIVFWSGCVLIVMSFLLRTFGGGSHVLIPAGGLVSLAGALFLDHRAKTKERSLRASLPKDLGWLRIHR